MKPTPPKKQAAHQKKAKNQASHIMILIMTHDVPLIPPNVPIPTCRTQLSRRCRCRCQCTHPTIRPGRCTIILLYSSH